MNQVANKLMTCFTVPWLSGFFPSVMGKYLVCVCWGGSFCYCLEDLSVEEYTHIEMHMDSEGVWMRNPEFKKK